MVSHQHANHPDLLKTIRRLLGTILVNGGFITPYDLDAAFERQKATNNQLGEILVNMGVLHPLELRAILAIQKDPASPLTAVKTDAGIHILLGDLLLKAQRINCAQLDLALREQQRTGEKLGEVLVRSRLLLEQELHRILTFQENMQRSFPGWEKVWLDELLVATGQITREQLNEVLKRQKLSGKKTGELLVGAGYLKPEQISQGLRIQQMLVTAALIEVLSLSNLISAVPEAHAGSPLINTNIAVTARVLEHTNMELISQARELTVTNADIQQGFINIPAASRITVKSNNPAGYLLTFKVMSGPYPLFSSVQVNVGGREVLLTPAGGWVPQPYVRGGAVLDISYHFVLSEHARPGTYRWPLMVSVSPM